MTRLIKLEESAESKGKYRLVIDHEAFFLTKTSGSYNVIFARLMNLSYAQFLRFCRDCCGAEIIGKGKLYPVPYFTLDGKSELVVDILNKQATLVLQQRNNPDWLVHQRKVINNEN